MGEWVNVISSDISCVKYEDGTRIMTIRFNKGGEYEYYDVYEDDYYNLISASSPGGYFHANIKNKYQCKRVY